MLELHNISKSFQGIKALTDVSATFREGEIHAVLGENGAGKSTLMKIICGIYRQDQGEVSLDGKALNLRDFSDAVKSRISIVNQEINLIPNSSIAENIALDKMDQFTRMGIVNWPKIYQTAEIYMQKVGLALDPKTPVIHLSAAQKQLIQIAKALSTNAKVLMLDEPTSSLTQYEANVLFGILRELKREGVILIFVSHKLEEVMALCDKVTVLRDGRLIGTEDMCDMDRQKMIRMMIGRESNIEYRGRLNADKNPVAFEARGVCSKRHGFKDLSFSVRSGEILGFYGLVGSGRSELVRTVLGIDKMSAGEIYLHGQRINPRDFSQSLHKYGIGYVTENRKEEGLFLDDSVKMNVCLNSLRQFYVSHAFPFIAPARETRNTKTYVDKLEIKTASIMAKASSMSGGNQQKTSIAKWLSAGCEVLVIDEPTVGVDVGAKEYIHQLIWDLAAKENKAVILISSDMNEIISLARRIMIFKDKRIVAELAGEETFARSGSEISHDIAQAFL